MIETKRNWTPKQIITFQKFHNDAKRKLALGETRESAYADKPEGYDEWAEKEFNEHGGVRLPRPIKVICSNPKCKKEHLPSDRCPFCGVLTLRRRS
jgi:hypothetical protein